MEAVRRGSTFLFCMSDAEQRWEVVIKVGPKRICVDSFYLDDGCRLIDPSALEGLLELVTRVNFSIPVGSFQLDIARSTLAFHTDLYHKVIEHEELLNFLPGVLDSNIASFHRHLIAINLVVAEGLPPKLAWEAVAAVPNP